MKENGNLELGKIFPGQRSLPKWKGRNEPSCGMYPCRMNLTMLFSYSFTTPTTNYEDSLIVECATNLLYLHIYHLEVSYFFGFRYISCSRWTYLNKVRSTFQPFGMILAKYINMKNEQTKRFKDDLLCSMYAMRIDWPFIWPSLFASWKGKGIENIITKCLINDLEKKTSFYSVRDCVMNHTNLRRLKLVLQSDDVAICNKNRSWPHLKSNRANIYITSTVTRKLGWKKSVPKLNLLLISSSTFLLIFLLTVWWISFSSEAFCLLLSWNYYHTTAHPRSVCFTLLFLKQHTSLDRLSYKIIIIIMSKLSSLNVL